MDARYITDETGKRRGVILAIEEYERMLGAFEDLEVLKAFLPSYRERVKLVFIDPPYNTGNENWVYNDRMNAPKIKE